MFDIEFLEEAVTFLDSLEEKTRMKVLYNIRKSRVSQDPELLKKLTTDIWEFRTIFRKQHYRLLAFWDKKDENNTLVVCTHGIVKKSTKVPNKEIKKAEGIMKAYFSK